MLYEWKPTMLRICNNSFAHEVLYAQEFHGKPVNIFDLIKSENAKLPENKAIDEKLGFKNGPMIKILIAIKILKNNGININANGINILKFSSNVSELVIHDIPLR